MLAQTLSTGERLSLITRGLPAVSGTDEIQAILTEGSRSPKGIWVTVPTGRPHLGYMVPLLKMVDFLRAGVDFNVCLGDIYGFLINFKYPISQVEQRKKFYKFVLGAVFDAIGVPASSLPFVDESSYAYTPRHIMDMYRLSALSSQRQLRETGDEVGVSTMFGPMLTPILQALDEEYQGSDFDFGGLDQRGLFEFAEELLPKMGYKKRAHLMNDMLPGLNGGKMSASLPDSKIDCLDSPETIRNKIMAVQCREGDAKTNGLLAIVRLILIPLNRLRLERSWGEIGYSLTEGRGVPESPPYAGPTGTVFTMSVDGTTKHYQTYLEIEQEYTQLQSHEAFKNAVSESIVQILAPVRESYSRNPDWQAAEKLAYPEGEEEFISTAGILL
ncbi:uncharacterized protein L3040_009609 [Drepanopeziza brunnea f. sp. 'multigermtubi']|uniref:uncharacterized protein n=1 Tax=Drepanopeziza brunnea f. sp. 'multigermtubi' TaxID=698441 RepID=UPI002389F5A6|nr:hypothetical protein L3040_009609 [Drepanopeziza brunnea f. sp. 'multigermtubi']